MHYLKYCDTDCLGVWAPKTRNYINIEMFYHQCIVGSKRCLKSEGLIVFIKNKVEKMNLWKTKRVTTTYSGKLILLKGKTTVCSTKTVSEKPWSFCLGSDRNQVLNMKVCITAHIVASTSCLQTVETSIFRDKICNKWKKNYK